jgi:hypothetical protein
MKQIVVLHRGWIILGEIQKETPTEIEFINCSVIRKWGTKKGIGEIALNGPTENTILEPCGTVLVHPLSIIMRIKCQYSEK